MTIVKAVDSYAAPNAQQLALAKAGGVVGWNGYLPGLGIDSTWTAADFARIRAAGLHSIAYASGRADPIAMKLLAAAWGVKGCLDVEGSIRGDGPWVQSWLTASGFGLYGNAPVHSGRTAAFHVLAQWTSDPQTNWPGSPLPTHGWQWAGNVILYAAHVDLCWFDEAIYVPPQPRPSPPSTGETEMPWFYQAANGTIYMVCGGSRLALSAEADVLVFTNAGALLVHASQLTVNGNSEIAKLPVL